LNTWWGNNLFYCCIYIKNIFTPEINSISSSIALFITHATMLQHTMFSLNYSHQRQSYCVHTKVRVSVGSIAYRIRTGQIITWKQGTRQRFILHSGQWYFVFRLKNLPRASMVFQQKLHPSAGPERNNGQWSDRVDSLYESFKFVYNMDQLCCLINVIASVNTDRHYRYVWRCLPVIH